MEPSLKTATAEINEESQVSGSPISRVLPIASERQGELEGQKCNTAASAGELTHSSITEADEKLLARFPKDIEVRLNQKRMPEAKCSRCQVSLCTIAGRVCNAEVVADVGVTWTQ
jgi:hypothetical protein